MLTSFFLRTINNNIDYIEIANRVKLLSNANVRKWGRITLQQMLVHCTAQLRLALGEITSHSQGSFMMRTAIGKWIAFSNIPWPKGSNTPNEMNIEKNVFSYTEIEAEKNELLNYLEKVKSSATLKPHPFFGALSKREWGRLVYKHVDHHLKQFSQ